MFKSIVLIPTQGFGHRIKAITSAKILSEYYMGGSLWIVVDDSSNRLDD